MKKLSDMQKADWQELAERYFDATTTEAEEDMLRRYLASDQAEGPAFDEVRAVMGLFAAQRSKAQFTTATPTPAFSHSRSGWWRTAAVAAVLLAAGVTIRLTIQQPPPTYYACIGGQVTTDRQTVVSAMQDNLDDILAEPSPTDIADQQLSEMFNTLDE